MDFDEGLRVLGVGVDAGKKGARRAYLKLVKKHKPDRDPVGFQRVREAYEVVEQQIEWHAPTEEIGPRQADESSGRGAVDQLTLPLRAAAAPGSAVAAARSAHDKAPLEPPANEVWGVVESDPSPEDPSPATPSPANAPPSEPLETLPGPPTSHSAEPPTSAADAWIEDVQQQLLAAENAGGFSEALRNHVVDIPDDDAVWEVYWFLSDELSTERLAEFLRHAEARLPSLKHAVALNLPSEATPDEIRHAHDDGALTDGRLVSALAATERYHEAGELALAVIEGDLEPHVPPYALFHLLFALEKREHFTLSEKLFAAYEAQEERLASAHTMGTELAVDRHLVGQYFQAAGKMSGDGRVLIGGTIHDQNWDEVAERLRPRGGRNTDREACVSARAALRQHGRDLHDILFPEVALPDNAALPTPKASGFNWGWWVLIVGLLQLVRLCGKADPSSTSSTTDQGVSDTIAELQRKHPDLDLNLVQQAMSDETVRGNTEEKVEPSKFTSPGPSPVQDPAPAVPEEPAPSARSPQQFTTPQYNGADEELTRELARLKHALQRIDCATIERVLGNVDYARFAAEDGESPPSADFTGDLNDLRREVGAHCLTERRARP